MHTKRGLTAFVMAVKKTTKLKKEKKGSGGRTGLQVPRPICLLECCSLKAAVKARLGPFLHPNTNTFAKLPKQCITGGKQLKWGGGGVVKL